MTESTRTVFEKYEIRKTRKQKTAFIEYVQTTAADMGYSCRVEKGWLGARNIVVGNPEEAKVVYTAHYDTCPVLPFPNFITPRHVSIYLLYQIAIAILFVFVPMVLAIFLFDLAAIALGMAEDVMIAVSSLVGYLVLMGMLLLILAGPANRHTANDNTSGVTTLLDILHTLPEELRNSAAFVFFDLEEMGLFGSMGFYSAHKKAMKNKLLLNFDCVSDGEHILLALQKKARKYAPVLEKAFPGNDEVQVEIAEKGVFYPSDQVNFPCGVGAAALRKTKHLKIGYMGRIHTKRDTIYREENIAFLTEGAVRLAGLLTEN